MDSIFDTDEDFEFLDDDILGVSLYTNPTEKSVHQSKNAKAASHLLIQSYSDRLARHKNNLICSENIEKRQMEHWKDESTTKNKFGDNLRPNHRELSDTKSKMVSAKFCSAQSGNHTINGYKFHSFGEKKEQYTLKSLRTSQKETFTVNATRERTGNGQNSLLKSAPQLGSGKCGSNMDVHTTNPSDNFKVDTVQSQKDLLPPMDHQNFRPGHFSSTSSLEDKSAFPLMLQTVNDEDTKIHTSNQNDDLLEKETSFHANPLHEAQSKTASRKRKFPGPAGILPKLHHIQNVDHTNTPNSSLSRRKIRTPKSLDSLDMMLETEDDDFKAPFWLQLEKKALHKYADLVYHTISMVLKKAFANKLERGKVPLMCALIKSITVDGADASVVLKDPTGEIQGTIHKGLLQSYRAQLCPGSGVILKQVSIFSPSYRSHYVNITPSNIAMLVQANASCFPCSQPEETGNDRPKPTMSNSMDTDKFSNRRHLGEKTNREEENTVELFAKGENLDSWLVDSDDSLTEISEELLHS